MLNRKEQIHFIGIGGAGMFPMAEVLHRNGYKVTGSDAQESDALKQLRSWGIEVQVGHNPLLVQEADLVVHTSAVSVDNPEIVAAQQNGAVIMKRAVMLGDLMRRSFSIGIAGTHGKTTTTSLVATILDKAGKEPTVIVGGIFRGSDKVSGAMVGDGTLLVAEADEYDRSFLQMYPSVAVVTNIEADHLDIYKDLDDIRNAFTEYVHRVPFYGQVMLCIDDAGVCSIRERVDKPVVTYGFSTEADFHITHVDNSLHGSTIDVTARGKKLGSFDLTLTGKHNQQNALAAIAVAFDMGVSIEVIKEGLASFPGVKRRMEILGKEAGVTVIDDYAHHPTEVAATLSAVKETPFSRTTVFFQPHLYSRTADLRKEFALALKEGADRIYVLPIYKAREKPIDGVSGQNIVDDIYALGGEAVYLEDLDSIASIVAQERSENEVILLMGAGDVWKWGDSILEELKG